jgi:hypothetical protein
LQIREESRKNTFSKFESGREREPSGFDTYLHKFRFTTRSYARVIHRKNAIGLTRTY